MSVSPLVALHGCSLTWTKHAAIVLQRLYYGNKPPPTSLPAEENDLEQALALDEE